MNSNASKNIFEQERKNLIVNYVNQKKKATVPELCEEFSVSPATIRNDLRFLAEKGILRRTHGGALSKESVGYEPDNTEKKINRIEAKQAIAGLAARYIHEGDIIALDAGTTTYELAKVLIHFKNLIIITYDIDIAYLLEHNSQNKVIMVGGVIRNKFNYTVGEIAVSTLEKLNADIFFLSANGLSLENGICTPDTETGLLKKILMRNTKRTVLLADSTKVGSISLMKFAELTDVHSFISDADIDGAFVEKIRERGVEVLVAKKQEAVKES